MKTNLKQLLCLALGCLIVAGLPAQINVQMNGGLRYTPVRVTGSTAAKFDIVFVGDGYTLAQQDRFNQDVDACVAAMAARAPYSTYMCAVNIWRVNVISAESGADHPMQMITRNTELNCTYGTGTGPNPERLITTPTPERAFEAANFAPARQGTFLLVNDPMYGGAGGGYVTTYNGSDMPNVYTHELGHFLGLADEYNDGAFGVYSGAEPTQPNLSSNLDRATTKWSDLIDPGTALPTGTDVPAGVVGMFLGGGRFSSGIYRPVMSCHMRVLSSEFCPVCSRHIVDFFSPNCNPCTLDPGSFGCLLLRNRWRFRIRLIRDPFKIRIPIPPTCLSCPPFDRNDRRMKLILEGLPQELFQVRLLNQDGKEIEGGSQGNEKSMVMEFGQAVDKVQFVELSYAGGGERAEALEFTFSKEVNGRR